MNMHARIILAGALLLSCFAAQAQQADAAMQAEAQQPAAQAKVGDDPHCLRYTGSLVVAARNASEDAGAKSRSDDHAGASKQRCIYSSGRAYSQDDIRRTGQTDIGRALQMLDPSVSLGH